MEEPDKCLIGTKVRAISINQNQVVIKTGGGYDELSAWITNHATMESCKLAKTMPGLKNSQQFVSVLLQTACPKMHMTTV